MNIEEQILYKLGTLEGLFASHAEKVETQLSKYDTELQAVRKQVEALDSWKKIIVAKASVVWAAILAAAAFLDVHVFGSLRNLF